MTHEEEAIIKIKALEVWSACEDDQSTKNVLNWCEIYGITYEQAMELKDFCLVLNSKRTIIYKNR